MGHGVHRSAWLLAGCLIAVGVGPAIGDPGVETPGAAPGHLQADDGIPSEARTPALLLIDESVTPEVRVRWRRDGAVVEHAATAPFGAPSPDERLEGTNIGVFVALGGTRLELGAGHRAGAILRVGLGKADAARAFFAGIDPGTDVEIEVTGTRFNQPVRAESATALVRLQYSMDDIEACALPPDAAVCYLTASTPDTLGGLLRTGVNLRPGELDGDSGRGSAEAWLEDDGSVSFRVVMPYGVLRHVQDPWASELPGTFFEPVLVQAEVEVLPAGAPSRVPAGDKPD